MTYNPDVDRRRSIRLPHWDYRENGAYFVTICTHDRVCLFRDAHLASIVEDVWRAIPDHFANATVDEFVMMPNHVHGIICITRDPMVGARHDAPLQLDGPPRPVLLPGSLGAIVLQFKSAAGKRINETRRTAGAPVWQRNYFERVLRNERELERAREYILDNPRKWAEDKHNPAVFTEQRFSGGQPSWGAS